MKNLLIIVFTLLSTLGFSQGEDRDGTQGEFYTGGGLVFNVSNRGTNIGGNPILGYRFTDELSFGAGINVQYAKFSNTSFLIFGPTAFGRYLITDNIYAQSEFHYTNVERQYSVLEPELAQTERVWSPALFVGGGYRQSLSGNVFANFTILYDVIQDSNSPYFDNLLISGGVSIGL